MTTAPMSFQLQAAPLRWLPDWPHRQQSQPPAPQRVLWPPWLQPRPRAAGIARSTTSSSQTTAACRRVAPGRPRWNRRSAPPPAPPRTRQRRRPAGRRRPLRPAPPVKAPLDPPPSIRRAYGSPPSWRPSSDLPRCRRQSTPRWERFRGRCIRAPDLPSPTSLGLSPLWPHSASCRARSSARRFRQSPRNPGPQLGQCCGGKCLSAAVGVCPEMPWALQILLPGTPGMSTWSCLACPNTSKRAALPRGILR
mmetsp:Transcript_42347/g.122500  ORF Transcript_42347/g.122500 Transcript_42347/m.122500 type:complete len:251 (+) Transcript_42347:577-1329(+)